MNKKGNLFFLIKSLNRSERRYFKLFCSTLNVESNYLKLFDAIDNQDTYNETQLKVQLGNEAFTKQLHVTKIYLSQLILKCLRNYHHKISKTAEILDLIRDIEILYSKELFDQCFYTIEKAEKLAIKFEKLSLTHEIASWKRRLYLSKFGADQQRLEEVHLLEDDSIDKMITLSKYWKVTTNISRFSMPGSPSNDFADLELSEVAGKPNSISAEILYHHLTYTQGIVGGDSNKAENSLTALTNLLEEFPEWIKDDPTSFINGLNNHITFLIFNRRYEEALPLIKKVRSIPDKFNIKKSNKLRLRTLLRTYNIELELYRDQKDIAKSKALIPAITSFLNKYEKAVPDNYFILFWNQFAYVEFIDGSYAKALTWVNKIMQIKSDSRIDIQRYTRLLHLIIHFELGNVIFLRYSIESCRRFLRKTGAASIFEKICLKHFAKLSHLPKSEYQNQLLLLHHDLFIKNPQLVTTNILDYIDIKKWLDGKLPTIDKPPGISG